MKSRRSWLAVALACLLAGGCGGGGDSEELSEGTPSEFGDAPATASNSEESAPAGDAPAPPALTAGPSAEAPAPTPAAAPTTPPTAEATAAAGATSSDAPAADNSGTLAMLQAANNSAPAPDQAGNNSGQPGPQGYPAPGSQGPGGPAGYPMPGSSGGQMAGQGSGPGGPGGYPMPGASSGPGGPGGYPMPGQSGSQTAYNQNAPGRNAGSGGMRPDSTQGGGPAGYPMPGANGYPAPGGSGNMAANMQGAQGMAPGGRGGDSAMAGMMPGYGGGTGGKPDYSQPVKAVESFLNAVRNRDLALLAESVNTRASSDAATGTMQTFFTSIIERSIEPNQLGELATEMSNYKVVRALPQKSTAKVEVLIGKEGKDDRDRKVYFTRKITVRKEKTLWKVLDLTKATKTRTN